jgi:HEAT repeat protein
MGRSRGLVLLVVLCAGSCGRESTAQLIADLKAPDPLTRLKAVRTLPLRQGEAGQVVPALTEALKDEDPEVRKGAAFGLGSFREKAKDAIPALQAAQRDPEAEVRKAAGVALAYIDPGLAPKAAGARGR